jgi:hypothetical protein
MKTLILIRFKQVLAATFFTAALVAVTSYAGLNVPYTLDADTLHLFHFDGPTNTIASTDDVVSAGITLTNFEQSVTPGSRITLGNLAAITQLGTCIRIAPTNLNAGNAFAFAVNGTFWPDTTPFRNPVSGAFTLESLVRCDGNPNLAGNGNWEIIAGDNSPGAGQSRGWQFRIQTGTTPQLDFNFITGGGGNFLGNLPKSGPNILLPGIWYHAAVTYTGNAPTNGDTAGILTFYWTVLDGGRTNATALTNFPTAGTFTLGGTPVLGIGGSARNMGGATPTIANGEGFKGAIDEVRISDICRKSNEMAFGPGVTPTSPAFLLQPPTNTFIGYGQPLTLPALATSAPTFYWYHAGTNLPSQTDSTLFVPNATFADAGDYQLVASNSINSVTSVVAHVTIGATPSELFNTGIAADGTLATALTTDAHYVLTQSSDVNHLAPDTTVWDMTVYPIAASGGNFSNPDGNSQWIAPQGNPGGAGFASPVGPYLYRTTFVLDSVDLASPFRLSGIWYVNEFGSDILINGQSTSNALSAVASSSGKFPANFAITNGFVPGLNTLDFVTTRSAAANGSYQESALRVSITGLGQALAPGKPVVNNQPTNVTVRENGHATFAVVALGRPPLSYQWYADGTLITAATNRTLALNPVFTGGQGTNFTVVIKNDSGSVTSAPAAVLTLTTNRPPVPPPTFHLSIYSNQVANVSIASIVYGSTDADNDPITLLSFDGSSTNLGAVVQNGINLSYTPPPDYTGPDQYSYTIFDTVDMAQGLVQINVLPLLAPTISTASKAGGNIVFSGGGGAAGGGYTVLTATNVLTPLTNWTVLTTGTFNNGGNFSVTNAISAGPAQRYYLLQVP